MSTVADPGAALTAPDLHEITGEVFAAFLSPDGLRPEPTGTPLEPGADIVHASVTVHGAWNGQVLLEVTEGTARDVARAMLATDEVTTDDVTDAVGELVNMVGGNVKSLMSSPSALGLPMVISGAVTRRATHDVVEVCTLDLAWQGRPLRVSVWEAGNQHQHHHTGENR